MSILVGAFFKFVLNEGIARWQLATGKTVVEVPFGCAPHECSAAYEPLYRHMDHYTSLVNKDPVKGMAEYLERHVYCCGPEPFMKSVREMLTALGFGLGWAWPGLLQFAVVRLNPSAPAAARCGSSSSL